MGRAIVTGGGGATFLGLGGNSTYNHYYYSASGIIGSQWSTFDWAPRWMEPYYDTTSILRKLYNLAIINPQESIKDIGNTYVTPKFYGTISSTRLIWRAKYNKTTNHIPAISIVISDANAVSGSIRLVETYGQFLYERFYPVAYYDSVRTNTLLLKNISLVRIGNVAGQGRIELGYIFDLYPILEDSLITLIDPWGDTYYYDQNDPRFDGRGIYVEKGGYFSVQYTSKTFVNQFIAGTAYITIDGERVFVTPVDARNTWDEYGDLLGITRSPRETNKSLKFRAQQLSFLEDPEARISAIFGQSKYVFWDTHISSVNIATTGATSATFIDTPQYIYITEQPEKDGNYFRLSYVPDSYVQLFIGNKSVINTTYSVSGGWIVPLDSDTLDNLSPGTVTAQYITKQFSFTESGNFITDFSTENIRRDLVTVILGRNIKIEAIPKKINEWRWNKENGVISGEAIFD